MKIVLIGGGHSHAIVLKLLGQNPIDHVQLTLISDTSQTPYSGMLPGYIAGFYPFEETHIDLISLARFAQAKLYLEPALGLNLSKNQVLCNQNIVLDFDILSIDTGSTPETSSIQGANQYATPAKPVPKLLATWHKLLETATKYPEQQLNISIIGGGAGGVELAFNMQSHLAKICPSDNFKLNIFQKSELLLPHHNNWVQNKIQQLLESKNIQIYLRTKVEEILPKQVVCQSGLKIPSDYIFLVTQASAPAWIKNSGLATDEQGFILTTNTLQSLSHPHIFATGDIATIQDYPRPKAGVFAVRQGKPLEQNLRRMVIGKTLQPYFPQKQYLSLIGTGDKKAIASWGNWGCQSPLFWLVKDYIDRQFMAYVQGI
jgi:pyridine nucleotide-disulfide oxidoreductase family protein